MKKKNVFRNSSTQTNNFDHLTNFHANQFGRSESKQNDNIHFTLATQLRLSLTFIKYSESIFLDLSVTKIRFSLSFRFPPFISISLHLGKKGISFASLFLHFCSGSASVCSSIMCVMCSGTENYHINSALNTNKLIDASDK